VSRTHDVDLLPFPDIRIRELPHHRSTILILPRSNDPDCIGLSCTGDSRNSFLNTPDSRNADIPYRQIDGSCSSGSNDCYLSRACECWKTLGLILPADLLDLTVHGKLVFLPPRIPTVRSCSQRLLAKQLASTLLNLVSAR
jgi:hypothetical protein